MYEKIREVLQRHAEDLKKRGLISYDASAIPEKYVPVFYLNIVRGLRVCEAGVATQDVKTRKMHSNKSRLLDYDDIEKVILVAGAKKEGEKRRIYFAEGVYQEVLFYYLKDKTYIPYPTYDKFLREKMHGVCGIGIKRIGRKTIPTTHAGRAGGYYPGMSEEESRARSDDLGHTPATAEKYYKEHVLIAGKKRIAEKY